MGRNTTDYSLQEPWNEATCYRLCDVTKDPANTRGLDLFLPFGAVRAGRGQLLGEWYI